MEFSEHFGRRYPLPPPLLPQLSQGPHRVKHDMVFSPSQVMAAVPCLIQWMWGYLHHYRPIKTDRGRVLGSLIHLSLERHYTGGNITDRMIEYETDRGKDERGRPIKSEHLITDELRDSLIALYRDKPGEDQKRARYELLQEAPRRAVFGIPHLPAMDRCLGLEVEQPLTHLPVFPEANVQWRGLIDLAYSTDPGSWVITDHKSTKGGDQYDDDGNRIKGATYLYWKWVKSAAELLEDLQAMLYALNTMLAKGLSEVTLRWVYYSTAYRRAPRSTFTEVVVTLEHALRAVYPYYQFCAQVLQPWVRWARVNGPPPVELFKFPDALKPDRASPCAAYGGCDKHEDKGGPCTPDGSIVDKFLRFL